MPRVLAHEQKRESKDQKPLEADRMRKCQACEGTHRSQGLRLRLLQTALSLKRDSSTSKGSRRGEESSPKDASNTGEILQHKKMSRVVASNGLQGRRVLARDAEGLALVRMRQGCATVATSKFLLT